MKRAVLKVLLVTWVFGMSLVLCIVPSSNVSANDPTPMGGGLYTTSGDWIVDATSTLFFFSFGETVVVNGDLTITSGYTLIFESANLQMNCAFDGEFTITVQSGATLIIKDIDGNPLTTGDRSVVNSSTPDGAHRFEFIVEGPNGELSLTNSELRDCGWEENSANNWRSSGLWIGTDNPINAPIITGNEIHDCVIGVTLYDSISGADISYNDIHNCSYTGLAINSTNNAVIDHNTLTTCGNDIDSSYSIHAWFGTNNEITYNEVVDHQYFGIMLKDQSGVIVDHNIIRNALGNGAALVLWELSGDNWATYNEIYDMNWTGMFIQGLNVGANMYVNNNTIHDILVTDGTVGIVQQQLDLGHLEACDNTIYNIDETGSSFYNNVGMTVVGGSGHILRGNDVSYVSDWGINIYANNVTVDDCDIHSNGDGNWNFDCGIFVWDDGTIIKNSRIYDNHPPIIPGPDEVNGIIIYESTNTLVENCVISNNEINIRGEGGVINSNNALIENCSISYGLWTNYDFLLQLNSDFITLNSTFDNSTSILIHAEDSLTCKWYLHVQVREMGSGVDGVEVWVNDTLGSPDPSTGQPFTTQTIDGEPGWVKWIPVTEFVETNSGKTYYTPHTINATLPGKAGRAIPNMWKSQEVIIDMDNIPQIVDFQSHGGISNVYRDTSAFIHINASDIEDAEDVLGIYVEYRVGDTSPWETTNFTGSAYYVGTAPSGHWEIEFLPPITSQLGLYDFRVRVEDTYPFSSEWYYYMDFLEILNNPPIVVSTSNDSSSVYRGDAVFVMVVGDDVEDQQQVLDCEIQYRAPGGTWSGPDSTLGTPFFVPNNWKAEFTPQTSPKDPIGDYDFRFRFQDTDGAWSGWETKNLWIEVLNNPPQADSLDAGVISVYRNAPGTENNFTWLFANVTEAEDPEDALTVLFEYTEPGIPGWQSAYIDVFSLQYDSFAGLWKVKFIPPDTAHLSLYNFRVTFTDLDGDSDVLMAGSLVEVVNNPPVAIDIMPSAPSINAGAASPIYINVNGSDTENSESELSIVAVEWQYNGPSGGERPGTWNTTWFGSSGYSPLSGGYLWVEFWPPSDAVLGYYGFRVKVMDLDSGQSAWIIIYDAAYVASPGPEIYDVTPQAMEVYRDNQLVITLNGSDPVDSEDQLTPHVEYRLNGTSTWTEISGITIYYVAEGYWEVYWTPDITNDTGLYEFRGRFENTSGIFSTYLYAVSDVTVLNNLPLALDIIPSVLNMRAGAVDPIYLHVNGSDVEDLESELVIVDIEWQYNGPSGGDRPGIWNTSWFGTSSYNGSGGFLEVQFQPPSDAVPGYYGFRVKVTDLDGGKSTWLVIYDAVYVASSIPEIYDVTPQATEVYRGNQVVITLNGSDAYDPEDQLTPHVEYRKIGTTTWIEIVGSPSYNVAGGYWEVYWVPSTTMDLGQYEFQGRFESKDGKYFSDYLDALFDVEIRNNVPEVIDMGVVGGATTMNRGDSITLYANGFDEETTESQLIVYLEYRASGDTWGTTYFGGLIHNSVDNRWEIDFTPDINAILGNYDFRVKFSDGVNESNWWESMALLTVEEMGLDVLDLTSPQSGYRTNTIYISANASYPNGNEGDLTAMFQYKGPTGDWISHSDPSSYFDGAPVYVADYWGIGFTPPADAELGLYSFRVNFTDGVNTSGWEAKTNWYNLLNNPPQPIAIDVPSTALRLESIQISADASDVETNEADLTAYFDYKGAAGDWISHTEAGAYFVGTPEYIDGSWHIGFNAPEDAELGMYSLRVRFSDGIDEQELITSFHVLNNQPSTVDMTVPESGYRLVTVYITANGSDVDHMESELTPEFEFKGPGDIDWIAQDDADSYFSGAGVYVDDFWRISFDPPADAELGYYSFRVRFSDGINTSDWLVENDAFTLMNHVPVVTDLSVKESSYRMETVTITANVTDMDDQERDLQPTFEYKGPSGTWISQDDVDNYFAGSPEFINGQWRIEFEAPDDAPVGTYSFRVRFTDGHDTSEWLTSADALTVMTHPEDKEEEEFPVWMWLLPLIIAILAILLIVILYSRRKKGPEEELPEEEGEVPPGAAKPLDREESEEEKEPFKEETPTTESKQESASEVPERDSEKPDELHKNINLPPPPGY